MADNDLYGGFAIYNVNPATGHEYEFESDHWAYYDDEGELLESPYVDGEWHKCARCGGATIIYPETE